MDKFEDCTTAFENLDPKNAAPEGGGLDHVGFGELFELSPVPMAVYSAGYAPVAVNNAFCTLLGVPQDILLSVPTIDYLHPEEKAAAREGMEVVLAGGEVPPISEFRVCCSDGIFRHIEMSSSWTTGVDGTVYLLVMFRDISEEVWNHGQ